MSLIASQVSADVQAALWQFAALNSALQAIVNEYSSANHPHIAPLINAFAHTGLEYAMSEAPVLTGTLRSSHFVSISEAPDWYMATLTLANLQNPLLGGWTQEYGPRVHDAGNRWMDRTEMYLTDQLDALKSSVEGWHVDLFRG